MINERQIALAKMLAIFSRKAAARDAVCDSVDINHLSLLDVINCGPIFQFQIKPEAVSFGQLRYLGLLAAEEKTKNRRNEAIAQKLSAA